MDLNSKNIILIGMPGAGKSTVGVVLAKTLGKQFCDTDLLIQNKAGTTLQQIINTNGLDEFFKLEESVLCSIKLTDYVIATGGSAVFSDSAMTEFKKHGIVIFLKLPLYEIEDRINNITTRGIAMKKGESLESVFLERDALYKKYADIIIDCENLKLEKVIEKILLSLL